MNIFLDFVVPLYKRQTHPEVCIHDDCIDCCIIIEPLHTSGCRTGKYSKNSVRIFESVYSDGSSKICKKCYSLFVEDKTFPGAILSILKKQND